MNEHVHPLFQRILNNTFAAQSPKEYYSQTEFDDDGQGWAHQQELEAQQQQDEGRDD